MQHTLTCDQIEAYRVKRHAQRFAVSTRIFFVMNTVYAEHSFINHRYTAIAEGGRCTIDPTFISG
jgi:hypothetical protein